MHNFYSRFTYIYIIVLFTFFTRTVYSEKYVIVDRDNGDRLTGRWINATDKHFEIEYNGQVLRFSLEGNTLSFISDIENVPDPKAIKHYRNGLELLDIDLPELAKGQFEAALVESPKYAEPHYQLGLLHKTDGDTEKALLRFRSILLIDAKKFDLVPLLQEIGENAVVAEEYTQAVKAFQLILTHYPEHKVVARLSYQTGFILVEKLTDTEAGLDLLHKTIMQFPGSPEHEKAVYLIGGLQAESGEPENALNTFQQFIRLYPDSDLVDNALLKQAVIYLQVGDKANAVKTANFVQRNTDDPSIVEHAKEIVSASTWNIHTRGLPDPNIQTTVIDEKSLWIGTPKGIAQIETGGNGGWKVNEAVAWMINTHTPTVPDVRAIAVNATGIWVGTRNQGIIHYNKKTNGVQNYTIPTPDGVPITWIRDIKMDNEEIWFATDAGVIREILSTGQWFHYYGNNPVPNDIHSIALTPKTVWVGTTGNDITTFNREIEDWNPSSFHDITQDTQIVGFDVIGEKMVFSWFNEVNNFNGFFHANWDGTEGKSSSIFEGTEGKTELEDIFVTGVVDNGLLPLENGEPNPKSLILWVADNDYVTIYYPFIDDFGGAIGYPKIALEDLSIQCITVDKNRAWIGTTKGMLTIDKEKVTQTTE